MKTREPNYIRVEGAAFRLHRDYSIQKPSDICIEDIAMAENLVITVGPLNGADGRLIRKGNKGLVRISDRITGKLRVKFTMTHEFGHWILHRDDSQFFLCSEGDMYDYKKNYMEVEANVFAAEMLMPKRWVKPKFWALEPSLAKIREMADFFKVSTTAAALRYVEKSKHACMIVFSDGRKVKWWRKRDSLPFWLQSNQPISVQSVACDCYNNGHKCANMESVESEA